MITIIINRMVASVGGAAAATATAVDLFMNFKSI